MRKGKLVVLLASLALSLSVGASLNIKKAQSVDAIGNYSTNASTYYDDITATSGKQLAAQLHDLITSTHRYYTSYDDNGKNLYQQKTDQYYENDSPVSGYIYEFYSGVKWPNAWSATAGSTTGGYNREHCWCQSNSVNNNGTQMWGTSGGGADMHHIRPAECRLNSTRNNHPYGEVTNRDSYKSYAKFGTNETYALGGYTNNSADIFEPLDSKKGDVARIILYTYLHYNSYTISDLFGSYGTTNGNGTSSYFSTSLLSLTKTTNKTTESAALEMLLRWNSSDPVDDIERRRNDQVAVYQGNRNPFIDNSSYADAIWGTTSGITSISKTNVSLTTGSTTTIIAVSSNGGTISWATSNSSICSISSSTSSSGSNITLTGVAAGSATITASITISGTTYSKTCSVTVSAPKVLSSISISGQQTSFTVGDSFSFGGVVTATYTDSTTANVTGSATFTGYDMSTTCTQTVTVSYTEGTTQTETYTITVSAQSGGSTWTKVTSVSDLSVNDKVVIVASGYDYALSTTQNNNNRGIASVTKTGSTVTWTGNSVQELTLTAGTVSNTFGFYTGSGYLYAAGSGSNYLRTQTTNDANGSFSISISNGVATLTAQGNNTNNVLKYNNNNHIFSCYSSGQQDVSLYKKVTQSGSTDPTLTSISLDTDNVQTSFEVGATFNYDGLLVTAHYSDDSSEDLDSFEVSSPDMTTAGTKTVTVTYSDGDIDVSETYEITVRSDSIDIEKTYTATILPTHFTDSSYANNDGDHTITAVCTTDNSDTKDIIISTSNIMKGKPDKSSPYYIQGKKGQGYIYNKESFGTITSISISANSGALNTSYNSSIMNSYRSTASGSSPNQFFNLSVSNAATIYASSIVITFTSSSTFDISSSSYSLVTNISDLGTGDDIIFVGKYSSSNPNKFYQATTISNNQLGTVLGGAPEYDIVGCESTATSFKVTKISENSSTFFRFRDTNNGYLSSLNGYGNKVKYETSSLTDMSLFSIVISNNGYISSMVGQDTSTNYRYFKFSYNSGTPFFACVTSATSFTGSYLYIYKKTYQVQADTWSNTFLSQTASCNTTNWSSLATSYGNLSNGAKQEIKSCIADPSTDYCTRSQAMARYEYMLSDARFNSSLTNFIADRNISNSSKPLLSTLFNKKNSESILLVSLLLVTSGVVIGYWFIFRRKKEQ